MADLGLNPLWKNLDSNSESVSNDILGPSYSYADNIPGPASKGVGSDGTFGQVFTNLGAATDYVKYMITGPALGNAYYVNTGGTCTAPDGSTQSRFNFINNVSTGSNLVPSGLNDLSFLSSDLNGLIPGIVGDMEGLDPVYLFNALTTDGNPPCACYKCNVTTGTPYQFLTPNLSPDFDTNSCTPVDASLCAQSKESFTNMGEMSLIPTLVAVAGVLLLTFSGK
jgi:hypothetical protein